MTAEQVREESKRRAGALVLARIGALAGKGPLTRIGAAAAQTHPRHPEVRVSEASEPPQVGLARLAHLRTDVGFTRHRRVDVPEIPGRSSADVGFTRHPSSSAQVGQGRLAAARLRRAPQDDGSITTVVATVRSSNQP